MTRVWVLCHYSLEKLCNINQPLQSFKWLVEERKIGRKGGTKGGERDSSEMKGDNREKGER